MRKYLLLLTVAVLAVLLLSACGCNHEWADATCNDPKTCTKCGAQEGEELGHDYAEANCEAPKTCTRCGKTRGQALGHSWTEANCEAPKTCTVCAVTQGEALGHDWTAADCDDPEKCSRCDATGAEALGHSWTDATCTEPKTCASCGLTEGEAIGHTWVDATYEAPKTCTACGLTEGEPLQQETVILSDLGITAEDYNRYINEVLATYNAEAVYVSTEDGVLLYSLFDHTTQAYLDVHIAYTLAENGNVQTFLAFTSSALDETTATWLGIVGGAGIVIADPTVTTEELTAMLSTPVYYAEDGSYTYYMEKNSIGHSLTCNDTTGEAMFVVGPIE